VLAPVDKRPVWSISCLFVAKNFRRQGLSRELLLGAAEFARGHGADLVEGYPIDPAAGPLADAFVWTGLYSSFLAAGFEEVARRSERRPVMRLELL
jgi:GNAT superfamily N-acetyltransferase